LYNTVEQHRRIMHPRWQRKKLLLVMKSTNWLVVERAGFLEAKYLGNIILAFYRIIKLGATWSSKRR